MGGGGAESQSSISERIDVRLDVEPGGGARLVRDAALTFGQAPLAPPERRDVRIGAEREGIERPLEREANLGRATELVFGRRGVQGRAGNPRNQRIKHA